MHINASVHVCSTLAFSKSRSLPMVDNSLQRHSRDSSSWFFSSFTMQSCMMTSVSILSLNSSPMNLILPSERLRALSLESCSSSMSRCFSPCQRNNVESWVKKGKCYGGVATLFLWDGMTPLRQPPAPSASSRRSRHHLYPFQTPSGIDLAAACGNSQWLPAYLGFGL